MRSPRFLAGPLLAALALLVSGCALIQPVPEPAAEVQEEPEVRQPPAPPPKPRPQPAPVERPQATAPRVAIILSDGKPAYQEVATELSRLLDNHSTFNLADPGMSADLAMSIIAETPVDVLVAIGLPAAITATSKADLPVIFCQVFNYTDHQLLSAHSKGVASLPPLEQQVQAWKELDPQLKSIGAILGEGHDDLIAEATGAAERHGVKLHLRTARSDRETLYLFNQLLPQIDGFWLFPDNRVLSPTVLRNMLENASHRNVQVAVFNESLLDLGAAMSATTNASDIAGRIVSIVEKMATGRGDTVPDITPLTEVNIRTNEGVLPQPGPETAGVAASASAEGAD